MTVNVDLLTRTLEHIEQHPDQWEQRHWAVQHTIGATCKTAFCFAGWAVQLNGHKISFNDLYSYGTRRYANLVDGELIEAVAERELGLEYEQAERLFDETNTLTELRGIVTEFVNEANTLAELRSIVNELTDQATQTNEPIPVA